MGEDMNSIIPIQSNIENDNISIANENFAGEINKNNDSPSSTIASSHEREVNTSIQRSASTSSQSETMNKIDKVSPLETDESPSKCEQQGTTEQLTPPIESDNFHKSDNDPARNDGSNTSDAESRIDTSASNLDGDRPNDGTASISNNDSTMDTGETVTNSSSADLPSNISEIQNADDVEPPSTLTKDTDGTGLKNDLMPTESKDTNGVPDNSEVKGKDAVPKEIIGNKSTKEISWFDLQFHDDKRTKIKKPNELENEMKEPNEDINADILNRVQGSMAGMALGDALGAHVEFRPHQFLLENPVTDLKSGGTWGLSKGQFTDDTSMALCLANSLIACKGFNAYDQLVRYKWWFHRGYMSSTGHCFDIGAATSQSLREFEYRQKQFAELCQISDENMDYLSNEQLPKDFNVYCSEENVAGNGALMRLAPVPLFFFRKPVVAVEYSGISGQITHGDIKAYDACRYYGALIVGALHGYAKEKLLDDDFYTQHSLWFGDKQLHPDIESIAKGSYKKDGYQAGIRGKGYIVNALEAALWAFWSDDNSFEKGALAAVNLGDDTDTTAAIYGQLAGAHYGYQKLPEHWLEHLYAKKFMQKLSKWIVCEGEYWQKREETNPSPSLTSNM